MKERIGKKFSPEQGVREVHTQITEIKDLLSTLSAPEQLAKEINEKLAVINQKFKEFAEQLKGLQASLAKTKQMPQKSLLANHDILTGLPNRLVYEDRILDAYYRWQRGFGDLSLAVAHIDNLAEIFSSDPTVGEKILQQIATLFKSSIRAVDFLARYDEQEFIFIFEQTHPAAADMVLEHLRALLEESKFLSPKKIMITASFGFSTLNRDEPVENLLLRAQAAMNKAKNEGGNQIASS